MNRDSEIDHEIAAFMRALLAMNLPLMPDAGELQTVAAALQQLASSPSWQRCSLREAGEGEEVLHVLARSADHAPALYLVSDGVGTGSPPHDHSTWAVIAGIRGREANLSYRVLSGESRTVVPASVAEVGPGDVWRMRPSEVHASRVVGDRPTFHLHLYGRPLDTLPPFASRCYAIGSALAGEPRSESADSSLLARAQSLHVAGNVEEAERCYRARLSQFPDESATRHLLGFLLYQADRPQDALTELQAAIATDDQRADWQFTLGLVLNRLGQTAAAIRAFESATRLDPRNYFGWTNLGAAQEQAGLLQPAEAAYLRAAQLDPNQPDAFFLLCALYQRLERYDEARRCNCLGLLADPPDRHPMPVRLHALAGLGRLGEARELIDRWLAEAPDHPVALHLRASFLQLPPERCSPAYIVETFDGFAPSFDDTITRLKYSGPRLVREHLAALGLERASLDALDLGCGTGLIGVEMAPYARQLVGVDLSGAMLALAASRGIYAELHQADLVDHLSGSGHEFDLICCMDTLIYLGRLEQPLARMYQRLRPGGRLLFTTELPSGPATVPGYRLGVSGRYAHHPDYLAGVLADAGFVLEHGADITVRNESGCPIAGQFFCARR